jgi:hypothetical protein
MVLFYLFRLHGEHFFKEERNADVAVFFFVGAPLAIRTILDDWRLEDGTFAKHYRNKRYFVGDIDKWQIAYEQACKKWSLLSE